MRSESWRGGEGGWDRCYFPTCAEMPSPSIFAQEETGSKKSGEGRLEGKYGGANYEVAEPRRLSRRSTALNWDQVALLAAVEA